MVFFVDNLWCDVGHDESQGVSDRHRYAEIDATEVSYIQRRSTLIQSIWDNKLWQNIKNEVQVRQINCDVSCMPTINWVFHVLLTFQFVRSHRTWRENALIPLLILKKTEMFVGWLLAATCACSAADSSPLLLLLSNGLVAPHNNATTTNGKNATHHSYTFIDEAKCRLNKGSFRVVDDVVLLITYQVQAVLDRFLNGIDNLHSTSTVSMRIDGSQWCYTITTYRIN